MTNETRSAFLTAQEVADRLRVHRRTIYRWARDGRLPAVRVGGAWRIPRSAVCRLMRGMRRR
jgi:excisionase family DNA binding protein